MSTTSPDWFGVLYDRHVGALYGHACRRIGESEAEDVVADTFVAAFSQWLGYDLARSSARHGCSAS
jgi:RNA polymerase sigma-70 factor (ECF subfamily)